MRPGDFPAPHPVALADALRWQASPDWTFETKLDGCRARLASGELQGRARCYPLPGPLPAALAGCILDGELVASTYFAFDVLEADGQNLRKRPLRERRAVLLALLPLCPAWIRLVPSAPRGMAGGEYLAEVLRRGGEGICAKRISAPYGREWFKAKRRETFDVVVASKSPDKLSVAVAQYDNGQLVPCGRVAVLSPWHFNRIHAGAVLELTAQGRTKHGAFREPAFVRTRTDKPQTACTI